MNKKQQIRSNQDFNHLFDIVGDKGISEDVLIQQYRAIDNVSTREISLQILNGAIDQGMIYRENGNLYLNC